MRNKIDIEQLRSEIRAMTSRTKLWQTLRDELSALGYWRNRPRGNPSRGFKNGWGK